MIVEISRNPFARETLVRGTVETSQGCDWCGRRRKGGRLFQYGTQRDAIRPKIEWHKGLFCSKECHDTYHGV